MQPSRSLSDSQLAAVQSVYTLLCGLGGVLDTSLRVTTPEDLELTNLTKSMALFCKDRLVEEFPELLLWCSLGDGQ